MSGPQGNLPEEQNLTDLVKELDAAMAQHKEAEAEESAARSRMCAATNRLNAAQKAIDTYIATMKRDAPWNTDWKRTRGLTESLP